PLPPTVVAVLKNIPKGQNEAKIQVTFGVKARLGPLAVSFTGKGRYQNREVLATAPPAYVNLVRPFTLKVEPVPFKVGQGKKAKVKVTAARKGGYSGPITVQLRNLPANVTANPATIAAGKESVEIEVTATATALVGDKAGVDVLGTAT